MKISTATIDCWLSVSGPNNDFDFQHHHWDIGPSGTIDTSNTNQPSYTWSVNANGFWAGNGSWSTAPNQSVTSNAQVWIDSSSNMVWLTQTKNFGVNTIPATGNASTAHAVSELIWPQDANGDTLVKWSPSAGTPSSISYQDMGAPTYQLVSIPTAVRIGKGRVPREWAWVQSMSLVLVPGMGGQDWLGNTQFSLIPVTSARAWWAWTINLV